MYGPDNMVFDAAGNVFLVDTDGKANSRVLVLAPDGAPRAQWRIFKTGSGERNGPEGIAMQRDGTVLVTDAGSGSVLKVSPQGTVIGTLGAAGAFGDLGHVAVDAGGNAYVAQAAPNLIEKFSPAGTLIASWHRERGSGVEQWGGPETIAVQNGRNLVVEDWRNRRIEILSPDGETLTTFGRAGNGPGEFENTAGLGVDRDGNVYVADMGLHRVEKFDSQGRWTATIGNAPGRTLFEEGPTAVAIDRDGNLYSPDGLSLVKYTVDGTLLARWR